MKTYTILIIVILISLNLYAEVELGIDFGYIHNSVNSEASYSINFDEESYKIRTNDIIINPRLSALPNDKIELASSLLLKLFLMRSDNNTPNTNSYYRDRTDFSFGFKFGTFFKLITNEHFRLLLGPEISFTYAPDSIETNDHVFVDMPQFELGPVLPLAIDLLIGDKVGLRYKTDLVAFKIYHYSKGYNNVHFSMKGILSPSLGLFVRLGK